MNSPVVLNTIIHSRASSIELHLRWQMLKRDNPKLRIRDAAAKLGVSELELLTLDSDKITRLRPEWPEIIKALEDAGPLMALTRNDSAVHEKTGVYAGLRGNDKMGLMIQDQIDLRLIFQRWQYAYAVQSETAKDSLQFFSADGTAIHKVYCTEHTNQAAWQKIVEKFQSVDLTPIEISKALPFKEKPKPLNEDKQALFLKKWEEMSDVHQFFGLLREFEISRLQSMQYAENIWTYPVSTDQVPAFISDLANAKMSIMVFVSNPGTVQIHTGPIDRCMTMGSWFNILDKQFNLHLNTENLAHTWIVRKPSKDGIVSSLEIYDKEGSLVLQLFGARQEGSPEQQKWRNHLLSLAPDMPSIAVLA